MSEPVLAQYTIRSKQSYILRTNRLAEIDGGSLIIADCLNNIIPNAQKININFKARIASGAFSLEDTLAQFVKGTLDVEELFTGGGNATFLFRDRETFARLNRCFTSQILRDAPGMIPMCVAVDAGLQNYKEDYDTLMAAVEQEKNRMIPGRIENAQPFAMMDRSTFQPLSRVWQQGGKEWRRTDEAFAKLIAGKQAGNATIDNSLLDDLVTQKDEESLLAIVHADGNNMGVKIQNKLGGHTDYDFCVNTMRQFTKEIDRVFTGCGKKAVDDCAKRAREQKLCGPKAKDSAYEVRWVVHDGDDITFICNARLAKLLAVAYLRAVDEYPGKERYSSCVGICIFHSHFPFSRAYALAEQACDSAKEPVHKADPRPEQCWMDFHFHRSGVGGDLDDIRDLHNTKRVLARPWFVCGQNAVAGRSLNRLDRLAKLLQAYKVSRSNVKTLGAALEEDLSLGKREWARICKNTDGLEKAVLQGFRNDELFRILYDLSEVYDLWYRKGD